MSKERFRRPRVNFTQVSNLALDHKTISPQAFWVYSKIQRYITLEDLTDLEFEVRINKGYIRKKAGMKQKTFDKYWQELLHLGFLKIYQLPDPAVKGQWLTEYELLHEPDTETPYFTQYNLQGVIVRFFSCPVENVAEQETKTPTPKKSVRDEVEKIKTDNEGSVNESIAPSPQKREGRSKGGSVKGSDGKEGGLNNNVLGNTSFSNTSLDNTSLSNTSTNSNTDTTTEDSSTEKERERPHNENVSLVEELIGLNLSKAQKNVVTSWAVDTLRQAIDNYIEHGGVSFAYLQACYETPVKTKNKGAAPKNKDFTTMYQHNWDLDELEERANDYMESEILPQAPVIVDEYAMP